MKPTRLPVTARRASHLPAASRFALAGASVLLVLTALWLSSAHAQTTSPTAPANATGTPQPTAPLQVGDATRNLLEKQRAGTMASDTPRPIAGEVAQRSYERYLRSFERPIPESFTTVASPAGKTSK